MADWKKYYEEHLISVEEAAAMIQSGDTLWCGNSVDIPGAVLNAMAARKDELENVTVIGNTFMEPIAMLMDPSFKKSFHVISVFANMLERMSMQRGVVDIDSLPYTYLLDCMQKSYKVNVILTEFCVPNLETGEINYGFLGCPFTPHMMDWDSVDKIIAVINKEQIEAHGREFATVTTIDKIDYFVEVDHPLGVLPVSPPAEADEELARVLLDYINPGDSIQLGMGGLADAIGSVFAESDHIHDMNIFSEIITDACMKLVQAGKVKKIFGAGAFGSKDLYDFLATTDLVHFDTVDKVLGYDVLTNVENFVAINGALMIDLTGQVMAEGIGPQQYSCVGGQLDFLRAAPHAPGGRSFLCVRSTYTDKEGNLHSNIVSMLPQGSIVTTPRYEVQYVVTEYGVADIYLRSIKDRIKALISISHPDFREELKQQVIELHMIGPDDFD